MSIVTGMAAANFTSNMYRLSFLSSTSTSLVRTASFVNPDVGMVSSPYASYAFELSFSGSSCVVMWQDISSPASTISVNNFFILLCNLLVNIVRFIISQTARLRPTLWACRAAGNHCPSIGSRIRRTACRSGSFPTTPIAHIATLGLL